MVRELLQQINHKEENRMEERISKQQLQQIYGVNRKTIEDWVQNYNLPMIQISPYKRFVRKKDLLEWEESLMVG
jgi:transposase